MNIRGWFPLGLTDLIFLLFKGLRFFLVLMTLTVMSNAFVRYFVECPSVKIIPELSPPIRKISNIYWYLIPQMLQLLLGGYSTSIFFFFLREIASFGHLLGSLLRQLDGKGTSVLYIELHICAPQKERLWGWLAPPSHRCLPGDVLGCGFLCCFWGALRNLSSRSLLLKISTYRSSSPIQFLLWLVPYVPFSFPFYHLFYFFKFLLE